MPEGDVRERSVEHQPSETALATATLRALAAYDEREEIRGPDHLAEIFLPEAQRSPLKDPAARQWLLKNKITPGAYEFMLARTAFFDRLVRTALAQNLPQLVFLGAGYDTRPYRFKDLVQDTRIFELDAAPTQRRKRDVLEQAGTPMPERLVYVPIDFRRGSLADALAAAGFSTAQAALFVWEGVTYYLPGETVDATLAAMRAVSAAGSSIGFDYAALSPEALGETRTRQLREHMQTNHPAEPARFGIPRAQIAAFLAERGYAVIEHLSAADMEAQYLTLRDGSLVGKAPALFALVHAAVARPSP